MFSASMYPKTSFGMPSPVPPSPTTAVESSLPIPCSSVDSSFMSAA